MNYEQNNLNKVFSKVKLFCSDYENGTDIIKEYCNEQIRLIQSSTENKIEQINKLNEHVNKRRHKQNNSRSQYLFE